MFAAHAFTASHSPALQADVAVCATTITTIKG